MQQNQPLHSCNESFVNPLCSVFVDIVSERHWLNSYDFFRPELVLLMYCVALYCALLNTVVIQNGPASLCWSLCCFRVVLVVKVWFPVDSTPEDKGTEKIVSSTFDKSILKEKPYWQYWYTDNKSVSVADSEHRLTFAKLVNHSGINPNIDFFFSFTFSFILDWTEVTLA